jgi:AraC-like DNA-binding protein
VAGGDVTIVRAPECPAIELWRFDRIDRAVQMMLPFLALSGARSGRGGSRYRYRGAGVDAYGAELAVAEPGEVARTIDLSEGLAVDMLVVDVAWLQRELADVWRSPHFAAAKTSSPEVFALHTAAVAAFLDAAADPIDRESILRRFLAGVVAQAGERPLTPTAAVCHRAVVRAREYLHAHHGERPSLGEVAAAAGVSVFHLERIFADRLGAPVHRYLQHVRIGEALVRLRRGERTADVAGAVGFADQAHMTRAFRKVLGFTPGAYARRR